MSSNENDVIDDALQRLRDYANGPYKIIEDGFYNNIRVVQELTLFGQITDGTHVLCVV